MLIPLTRKTFESLIPVVATGPQYVYYWGKLPDFLRRLLISVVGILALLLLEFLVGHNLDLLLLLLGIVVGLYWLWGPILWASLRNAEMRKYQYSGFWQGEVLDAYVTEELVGNEETVNNRGELVVVENRERRLNLVVGDEVGFTTRLQVPIKRNYQAIAVGDLAQMIILSNRGDLSRINQTTDVYIPDHKLWVSDYPCVLREAFVDVSQQLQGRLDEDLNRYLSDRKRRSRRPKREQGESRRGEVERYNPSRRSPRRRSADYSDF